MLSRHRIEKCTLQIALPSENNLEVVRLLAQEKPRILEAILAVFDQEIPYHQKISIQKIHLDLGTVSRRDFIPKLTERLVALLSAELKILVDDRSLRTLPSLAGSPPIETPVYDGDLSHAAGLYHDEFWRDFKKHLLRSRDQYLQAALSPHVDARIQHWVAFNAKKLKTFLLSLPRHIDVEERLRYLRAETHTSVTKLLAARFQQEPHLHRETIRSLVAHYFRTGAFPRAFEALQSTDIDTLANYLADAGDTSFIHYLSRRIGIADFQIKLAKSLRYDTQVKIASRLPALHVSLKTWLSWISTLEEGISAWKHSGKARLLFLQYLTETSAEGKTNLQEEYILASRTLSSDHPAVDYSDLSPSKSSALSLPDLYVNFTSSSAPAIPRTVNIPLDLPGLLGAFRHSPALRESIAVGLTLPALRALVKSLGISHGSYAHWQAFVRSVDDRYSDQHTVLPDSVRRTMYRRYIDVISIYNNSSLTFARLEQLMFLELQRLPAWQGVLTSHSLSQEGVAAEHPNSRAFAIIRFYYRYGYFPREAKHLQEVDLDTLMLYLLAWDSDTLTRYFIALLDNANFTIRLADTLSAQTLKTVLSATRHTTDALEEWTLWERLLESLIGRTPYPGLAEKITLLQYVRAPTPSTRAGIIYEYLSSTYAGQGSRFAPDVMMDALRKLNNVEGTTIAARTRIEGFLPFFAARENGSDQEVQHDRLKAFRRYLADAGSSIEPPILDHPTYAEWEGFETRMREALAEVDAHARESLLQHLHFFYLELLRRHGNDAWSLERFQQDMMREAEQLLAATTPDADVISLRLRIDATAATVTRYWKSLLGEMLLYSIEHIVSITPALQRTGANEVFWDTALTDETGLFSLFHEADVKATFWPELSDTLSLAQLRRLLSILAPFQYWNLWETGVLSKNVATTRETFVIVFKTLHASRYTIGSQKLIDSIFRGVYGSPHGEDQTQSDAASHHGNITPHGPTASDGPIIGNYYPDLHPTTADVADAMNIPEHQAQTSKDAAARLVMFVDVITAHRAELAKEYWKLLFNQHRSTLTHYVQTQWTWDALRDSLALDADPEILTGLITSVRPSKLTHDAWRIFTDRYKHNENLWRQIHRHYFDFLSSAPRDHSAEPIFTQWLADLTKTLNQQKSEANFTERKLSTPLEHKNNTRDEVNELLAALRTATMEAPASASILWRSLYTRHQQNLIHYIRAQEHLNHIHDSLALDAGLDILTHLSARLYEDNDTYSPWLAFTERYRHDTTLLRKSYQYYFGFQRSEKQAHQSTQSFTVWLTTIPYALKNVTTDTRYGLSPPDAPGAAAVNRSLTPFIPVSIALVHPKDVGTPDSAKEVKFSVLFNLPARSQKVAERDSALVPIITKANDPGKEEIDARSITSENELEDRPINLRQSTRPLWPMSLLQPENSPPRPQDHESVNSSYTPADIIIYYLKTGKFIPGAENYTALTKLTAQYFSEEPSHDNSVLSVAFDSPEAYRRLKPLLSPAALSHVQEKGSAINVQLPHYTTSRIKTFRQIEATLHYWLYGHWPWWYASAPAATAMAAMENHQELFIERLKNSGHELAIIQKITSSISQEVFLRIMFNRFPMVAGFVARVFLLLERIPVEEHKTGTPHRHTVFFIVYEYLVHHTDPFSAMHFLSHLAKHSAKTINIPESVWIDSMATIADAMQQGDAQFWSLHELFVSLRLSSTQAATITDETQPVATEIHAAAIPATPSDAAPGDTDDTSPTFKDAFVAYIRMGIIPLNTLESQGDKLAFTRQLQRVALQEPAWLTTTLKGLFMNAAALDEYLLRADRPITVRIIRALAGTRQYEFTRWLRTMEKFLETLYTKINTPQASALATRALILLLLQKPAFKITAIQYVQAVFDDGVQHKKINSLDTLIETIRHFKAANSISAHFVISLEAAHANLATRARTLLIQSLINPEAKSERRASVPEKGTRIPVEGAGIVLIAPFFYMYFNRLEMTENNGFKTDAHAVRAAHLLHYLVSGSTEAPLQPILYKLLCGVDLTRVLDDRIELTDHEKQVSESLLHGVLQNWTSLKSESIDALRETFLQRKGHLEENDMGWNLTVERKSMDILVDWIPWSFSLIKLSWMEKSLAVTWQSDQYRDLMPTKT